MAEKSTRSVAEIEEEIRSARRDLVVALEDLQLAVRERMDWRTWVRQRPVPMLGAAFALGFLIAMR
jgi:hypothetical protein